MTGAKSATTTTNVLHHRTLPNSSTPAHHSQDCSAKTTVHDSLSNSSSSTTSITRQDKSAANDTTALHEQTLPTTSNQPDCVCDPSAEVCHPDPLDESSLPLGFGHPQGFASTVVTTELDQDDLCRFSNNINVLLNHTLPKSRTRTNVVTTDYTPRTSVWCIHKLEEWVSLTLPLGFRRSRRRSFLLLRLVLETLPKNLSSLLS